MYETPAQFVKYFRGIRKRTLMYVDAVPEHLAEWRPQDGKFSIRELILHLGSTELMFCGVVQSSEWRYAGHDTTKGASVLETRRYLEDCHTEAMAFLESMSPSHLTAVVKGPAGEEVLAWRILSNMAEHEIHHRGQLSAYLQVNNVNPPQIFGRKVEEFQQV